MVRSRSVRIASKLTEEKAMSALAMILTAAMLVSGDVPEKVLGEVEQGLDLRGEWGGFSPSADLPIDVSGGKLRFRGGGAGISNYMVPWKVADEGNGKIRIKFQGSEPVLGIYKWRGDEVDICYAYANRPRPTSFEPGEGRTVLILHRVQPGR
jgi:hypothetical protein